MSNDLLLYMDHSNYIPASLLTYTFVRGLLSSARTAKAKLSGATEIFDAKPSLKAILIIATVGFSFGSIYVLVTPPRSIIGAVIFALIALSGILGFPNPIFLTSDRVQQLTWWGGRTSFPWGSVVKIEFHKGPATTVLIANDGQRIAHTGFHVASEQFREECALRSHLPLVTTEF